MPPRKIIIDTDPGQDDAVAILLALASPELEVLAITAVAGNVPGTRSGRSTSGRSTLTPSTVPACASRRASRFLPTWSLPGMRLACDLSAYNPMRPLRQSPVPAS